MAGNTTNGSAIFDTTTQVPNSGGGPLEDGYYKIQSENMWRIIPPIIILWGTLGNSLTIFVFLRQFSRLSSTATYILTMGVVDIMTLWLGPLRQWILQLWEKDVRKLTTAGCRIQTLLTYATVQISAWLLVAVTIERLLSVVRPHTVKLSCTPRRAGLVCGGIVAAVFALNCHYLWDVDMAVYHPDHGKRYDCIGTTRNNRRFIEEIWPWIDFVVAFLAPFLCLLAGNVGIIIKLESKRRWRRRTSGASHLTATETESRKITIMLIMLNVMFFVCMSPVSIFYIYIPELEKTVFAVLDPQERWDDIQYYFYFLPAVVNNIAYINASFNFVFYVLSGSKFRGELLSLVTCRKSRAQGVFGSNTAATKYTTTTHVSTATPTDGVDQGRTDIEPAADGTVATCVPNGPGNIVTNDATYNVAINPAGVGDLGNGQTMYGGENTSNVYP